MSDGKAKGEKDQGLTRRRALGVTGASVVAGLSGAYSDAKGQDATATSTSKASSSEDVGLVRSQSTPHYLPEVRPGKGAPNVLIILVDDVGFSDFGCYGGEIPTPAIDALAERGLRYTNFRTVGVCSATRASLLTGLNPHSAGVGWLTFADDGFEGYRGDLTPHAVTMAESFQQAGYGTYHVGKWHVNAAETTNSAGPTDNWPPNRGYNRSYWFQGHSSDYFHPAQFYSGTEYEPIEGGEDYYVTDDLTDQTIAYLRDHVAQRTGDPFFLTLAHPAAHSPLHAPAEDIARFKGKYDQGWDAFRKMRLEKQKKLGLFGESIGLPALNPGVKPWDQLSADEQTVFARYMEVYAAVIARTDHGVGRVMDALEELGLADDTLVILASDNGGSPDGGVQGTPNLLAGLNGGVSTSDALTMIDQIGGPDSYPMYPMGWATVSNTPFRLYKHTTHLGGVGDPMIVSWPKGISQTGGIRDQYIHVIDIFPTLAQVCGVKIPSSRKNEPAKPVQGRSFAETFASASAPDPRNSQHFELNGLRAYREGKWRIASTGAFGTPGDAWELFDLEHDPNETNDIAADHPKIVSSLERAWKRAAQKFDVFPIDDRPIAVKSNSELFKGGGRDRWVIYPPIELIPEEASPRFFGRALNAVIELEEPVGDKRGFLLTHGNEFLGFSLYAKDGELVAEYNCLPHQQRFSGRLPASARRIEYRQEMIERPHKVRASLLCDGVTVASKMFDRFFFGTPMQGLQVGTNGCGRASPQIDPPFTFEGSIAKVTIESDNSPFSEAEIARSFPARRIGGKSKK